MKNYKFRLGWVVAVLALATLACTCGLVQGLTQAGEGLQTVQAAATELATSGALETIEAAVTQAATTGALETVEAVGIGQTPEDIPVMDEADNLFTTKELVSYSTTADFNAVVDFYKEEMVAQGWTEASGSVETAGAAVLNYEKSGRTANVTIAGTDGQVSVAIAISGQ